MPHEMYAVLTRTGDCPTHCAYGGIGKIVYLPPEQQAKCTDWRRGRMMRVVTGSHRWFDPVATNYAPQRQMDAIFASRDQREYGYTPEGQAIFVTEAEYQAILAEYEGLVAAHEVTQKAECQRREECFRQARETGQPVPIDDWLDDCDDPREECDLDYVVLYALPDGTTRMCRIHTW